MNLVELKEKLNELEKTFNLEHSDEVVLISKELDNTSIKNLASMAKYTPDVFIFFEGIRKIDYQILLTLLRPEPLPDMECFVDVEELDRYPILDVKVNESKVIQLVYEKGS